MDVLTKNDESLRTQCSHCGHIFNVEIQSVKSEAGKLINCPECKQKIKIALCGKCGTSYSIAISKAKPGKYYMRCKKCGDSVMVEIPLEQNSPFFKQNLFTASDMFNKNEHDFSRHDSRSDDVRKILKKPYSLDTSDVKRDYIRQKSNFFSKQKVFQTEPARPETIKPESVIKINTPVVIKSESPGRFSKFIPSYSGKTVNKFDIGEIFKIASSSMSIGRIAAGLVTAIAILICIALYNNTIIPMTENAFSSHPYLKSFVNLFPFAMVFSIMTAGLSVISKMTLNNVFGEKNQFLKNTYWTSNALIISVVSNIMTLLIINSFLVFMTNIPALGTLLFAIIFLPLYLSAMLSVIMVTAGIWFYPPIIAHREEGVIKSVANFLIFLKKHNFTLILVLPLLFIISGAIYSFVLIVHNLSFYVIKLMLTTLAADEAVKTLGQVPNDLVKIISMTLFGSSTSLFKSFEAQSNILNSFSGSIIGLILSSISLIIMGIGISIVGTVSTHIYLLLERGSDSSEWRKIPMLIVIVLLLVAGAALKVLLS